MLSELKKKEILLIKGILDEYKRGVEETNAALDVIDEKYRKIIAEEKKTLKANLSEYKTQLKVYEKMFSSFDTTAVKEVLGDFESTSTAEEEGKIFDSIYSENNEKDEPENTPETVNLDENATVVVGVSADSTSSSAEVDPDVVIEPVQENAPVKDLDAEDDADWAQKIESGELVEADWNMEQPAPAKKELPTLEVTDEGWAEYPEEWK